MNYQYTTGRRVSNWVLLLSFAFVISSCSNKEGSGKSTSGPLTVDLTESKAKNELQTRIVDIMPISLPEAFPGFSQRLRLKKYENRYFVFDQESQQLLCVDFNGKFRFSVGGLGGGPNELQSATDFTYADGLVSFLISSGNASTIVKFDTLGTKISSTDIAYYITSFIQTGPDEYLLYTGWTYQQTPYRLFNYNLRSGEDTAFMKHQYPEEKMGMEAYALASYKEQTVFFDPMTPYIYEINSSLEVDTLIKLNLGDFEMGEEYWEKPANEAMQDLMTHGFYACRFLYRTDNYLAMLGNFTDFGENIQDVTFSIYDFEDDKVSTAILEPGTRDELLFTVFGFENNQMVSLGDGYVLKEASLDPDRFDLVEDQYYLVLSEVDL